MIGFSTVFFAQIPKMRHCFFQYSRRFSPAVISLSVNGLLYNILTKEIDGDLVLSNSSLSLNT